MAAYLKEKGIIVEPVYRTRSYLDGRFSSDELLQMAKELGMTSDNADKFYYSEEPQQQEQYKKGIGIIKNHTLEYFQKKAPLSEVDENFRPKKIAMWEGLTEGIGLTEYLEFIRAVKEIYENNPTRDYDSRATEDSLSKQIKDKDDFKSWIYGKISATEEKKGDKKR